MGSRWPLQKAGLGIKFLQRTALGGIHKGKHTPESFKVSNQKLIKFKKDEGRENAKDKMLIKQQKNAEIGHSVSLILPEKKLRVK